MNDERAAVGFDLEPAIVDRREVIAARQHAHSVSGAAEQAAVKSADAARANDSDLHASTSWVGARESMELRHLARHSDAMTTPETATRLSDARRQLHHAAQFATAAGISYLPARPDDSHTNLEWLPSGM